MKLVALVGMCGCGKTELAKMFEKKGWTSLRFGDITDDILHEKGLPLTEANEKEARENIRKDHGMNAYAKLNLEKIQGLLKQNNVVIDGLYSWEEYLFMKEHFPKIIILNVYTPPEMRYERLTSREIRPLTREQSISRDKKEIQNLNKGGPIAMADYNFMNVWNLHDMEENLEKFFEWMNENIFTK